MLQKEWIINCIQQFSFRHNAKRREKLLPASFTCHHFQYHQLYWKAFRLSKNWIILINISFGCKPKLKPGLFWLVFQILFIGTTVKYEQCRNICICLLFLVPLKLCLEKCFRSLVQEESIFQYSGTYFNLLHWKSFQSWPGQIFKTGTGLTLRFSCLLLTWQL